MSVFDEKYIKTKVKEFNGVVKTNFLVDEIPKESAHYTCIACITNDSVMSIEKKNYPQVIHFVMEHYSRGRGVQVIPLRNVDKISQLVFI